MSKNRTVDVNRHAALFADLVEAGRKRLLDELKRRQRSLTVQMPPEDIYVPMGSDRSTWRLENRRQSRNILAVEQFWLQSLLRDDEWRDAAVDIAKFLAAESISMPPLDWMIRADGSTIWEIWKLPDDSVSRLLAEFVVAPAWWCLCQLSSAEVPDPRLTAQVAGEIVDVLTEGYYRVRSSVPVTCALTGDHDFGSVVVRPVSDEEHGIRMAAERSAPWVNRGLTPTHIIEVLALRVDDRYSLKPISDAIMALELLGVRIGGNGLVEMQTVPQWADTGIVRNSIPMAQFVRPEPKLDSDLGGLPVLTKSLTKFDIDSPASRVEQALHRYRMSCCRDRDEDAIVDLAVALEAFFLPDGGGNGFRLAVNGANWVGTGTDERLQIHDNLRTFSKVRNAVVHGDGKGLGSGIHRSRMDGHAIMTASLRRAVETGFPDADWFRRALFSS